MSAALGAVQMAALGGTAAQAPAGGGLVHRAPGGDSEGGNSRIVAPDTTRMSWFVYVIRLARASTAGSIASRLAERGIPVRPYFLPIHLQPYMVERFGYRSGDFPVTEDLGERGLALPFSGVMSEEQVDLVCAELRSALGG